MRCKLETTYLWKVGSWQDCWFSDGNLISCDVMCETHCKIELKIEEYRATRHVHAWLVITESPGWYHTGCHHSARVLGCHPLGLFSLLSTCILSWATMYSLEHRIVIVFLHVNISPEHDDLDRTWGKLLELPYLCQPGPHWCKHLLAFYIRLSLLRQQNNLLVVCFIMK